MSPTGSSSRITTDSEPSLCDSSLYICFSVDVGVGVWVCVGEMCRCWSEGVHEHERAGTFNKLNLT